MPSLPTAPTLLRNQPPLVAVVLAALVSTQWGYCWTHGYQVHKNHSSSTCKHKADGHKDCATRANTMHGSTTNKGWEDA